MGRVTDHLSHRHVHEVVSLEHFLLFCELLVLHHIEIRAASRGVDDDEAIPIRGQEVLVDRVNALFIGYDQVFVFLCRDHALV